ncbi:MAG: phenylacetate--CoA ligase family protein [Acidimicrobiia bacterium]|nr:phenylacetate--CoA ligase family protein [Acidimicrobiia bacterium]
MSLQESIEARLEPAGREQIGQLQIRRFTQLLGDLLGTNGFYTSKLGEAGVDSPHAVRSLDDLRRLPFTTKRELSDDQESNPPYGSNLTFPIDSYVKIHQTSGTTGEPLRCLDTVESWEWWADCWATVFRAAEVSADDRIFYAFSFGPFIGFWSSYEGARKIGALASPGGGMSSVQRLKAIFANDMSVLVCTPTYALHLAELAEQEGIDLASSPIEKAILAGEPGAGLPATRARIQRAWGAEAFDHAGATEVGAWGFECLDRNGLHVNEGEFIVEIIDPDTTEPASEGEVVITNLGRPGYPVIRYRTGDRARIETSPCSCGRTFARLDGGVIGRVDDVLIVRGINVFPSAIENIIRSIPGTGEFAVDVRRSNELDEMTIRVEATAAKEADVVADTETAMRNALNLRVRVEPVEHGTLPRFDLKARRFTDHR